MTGSVTSNSVRLRFFLPPADLQPFVTTLYQMETGADVADPIEDRLHPEWANIRLLTRGSFEAAIGDADYATMPPAILVGPTSHATRFRAGDAESWGIGLLPLGWSRIVDLPASDYADRVADMGNDPALARLAPLVGCLHKERGDPAAFRDCLIGALRDVLISPQARDAEIVRLEHALVDPAVHSVAELGERAGLKPRKLERLCKQAFGFPPQLLLRRQRFLRSLAQFMLDPSLKWIETLDSHYHDQAHFVRDFKRFMGMSPSVYAHLPHPVLGAAAHARKAIAGEAVQVLHRPPDKAL